MTSVVNDLIEIAQIERARLVELTERMDECATHEVENVARKIEEVSTNLSSALTRLAKHIDVLPASESSGGEPDQDERILELAARVGALARFGLCPCGKGVTVEAVDAYLKEVRRPEYPPEVI